jgi:hypothetical protein
MSSALFAFFDEKEVHSTASRAYKLEQFMEVMREL